MASIDILSSMTEISKIFNTAEQFLVLICLLNGKNNHLSLQFCVLNHFSSDVFCEKSYVVLLAGKNIL